MFNYKVARTLSHHFIHTSWLSYRPVRQVFLVKVNSPSLKFLTCNVQELLRKQGLIRPLETSFFSRRNLRVCRLDQIFLIQESPKFRPIFSNSLFQPFCCILRGEEIQAGKKKGGWVDSSRHHPDYHTSTSTSTSTFTSPPLLTPHLLHFYVHITSTSPPLLTPHHLHF